MQEQSSAVDLPHLPQGILPTSCGFPIPIPIHCLPRLSSTCSSFHFHLAFLFFLLILENPSTASPSLSLPASSLIHHPRIYLQAPNLLEAGRQAQPQPTIYGTLNEPLPRIDYIQLQQQQITTRYRSQNINRILANSRRKYRPRPSYLTVTVTTTTAATEHQCWRALSRIPLDRSASKHCHWYRSPRQPNNLTWRRSLTALSPLPFSTAESLKHQILQNSIDRSPQPTKPLQQVLSPGSRNRPSLEHQFTNHPAAQAFAAAISLPR